MKNRLSDIVRKVFGKKRNKESHLFDQTTIGGDDVVEPVRTSVTDILSNTGEREYKRESLEDTIERQERIIEKQKELIAKQSALIHRSSGSSGIILAVSFITGGILSGVGTTLYGQMDPESGVQSSISSIAKKFSDTQTGYEIIQKGSANILVIKKQTNELQEGTELRKHLRDITNQQSEILAIQKQMIDNLTEKQSLLEKELLNHNKSEKKVTIGKKEPIKKGEEIKILEKATVAPFLDIFATVTKMRDEIKGDLHEKGVEMRIQEQKGGRVLVWVEYNGNRSLGFFADTPKFQNRLTKEGMNLWIQDSINQLIMVEKIESIALGKDIGASEGSPISMKIKKMYTGNIRVILSDSFSEKSAGFTIDSRKPEKQDQNISGKIDTILADFLS